LVKKRSRSVDNWKIIISYFWHTIVAAMGCCEQNYAVVTLLHSVSSTVWSKTEPVSCLWSWLLCCVMDNFALDLSFYERRRNTLENLEPGINIDIVLFITHNYYLSEGVQLIPILNLTKSLIVLRRFSSKFTSTSNLGPIPMEDKWHGQARQC